MNHPIKLLHLNSGEAPELKVPGMVAGREVEFTGASTLTDALSIVERESVDGILVTGSGAARMASSFMDEKPGMSGSLGIIVDRGQVEMSLDLAGRGATVILEAELLKGRLAEWIASRFVRGGSAGSTMESPLYHLSVLDQFPLAAAATDSSGRIEYWNAAAESMLGWPRRKVVGRDWTEVVLPAAMAEKGRKLISEVAASGGAVEEIELVNLEAVAVPAQVHLRRLEESGRVTIALAMVDLTERRQLEARLYQAQKVDAIATLAGGMAHEFNDILVGVLGAVSLARTETIDNPEVDDLLRTVESAAHRGRDLVSRVLSFTRGEPETAPLSGVELANDLAGLLRRTLPSQMKVNLEVAPGAHDIVGDRARLIHALLGLCSNAQEAMKSRGEIKINVSNAIGIPADSSHGPLMQGKPFLAIEIEDQGVGMEPHVLKRAFDPFFTTRPSELSSGLGLPMVVSTIRSHGGDVRLWSRPGTGTRAVVYLPLSNVRRAPDARTRADKADQYRGSETILIVDDEPMVRSVAARVLGRYGYKTQEAGNGKEGLDAIIADPDAFDGVLLDMVMPEMDGRDFFWKLQEIKPDMPVLLSSGFSVEGRVEQLLEAGASGFLRKPYELTELVKAVRKALDARTATGK